MKTSRDLGVSVVTVFKVLRHRSDMSLETPERVLRIRELKYRPNLAVPRSYLDPDAQDHARFAAICVLTNAF
jgi:DNA-binding LacI/PurR family transcriptional regulator